MKKPSKIDAEMHGKVKRFTDSLFRVFCREYNVKIVFSHDEEGRKYMNNLSKIEENSGTEKTCRNHVKTTKNGSRNASKIYKKSIKNPLCSAGAPGETKSRRRGAPGDTPGLPRGAPGASRRPWRNGPPIQESPIPLPALIVDEPQGRNLGQARHGGDPFENGPISNLARLYIR